MKDDAMKFNLDKSDYRPSSEESYNTGSMSQLNDLVDPMINKEPVRGSFSNQEPRKK